MSAPTRGDAAARPMLKAPTIRPAAASDPNRVFTTRRIASGSIADGSRAIIEPLTRRRTSDLFSRSEYPARKLSRGGARFTIGASPLQHADRPLGARKPAWIYLHTPARTGWNRHIAITRHQSRCEQAVL